MDVVHPAVREAFRQEEMRAIERAVRLEYGPLLKAAGSREERRRVRAALSAEIQARLAGLLDARRRDSGHCL
jgi:hypothetical protein